MRLSSVFIFVVLIGTACSKKKETAKPKLETVTESVYASVTLKPEGFYNVYSNIPGIIDNIFVKEGDTVTQGQIIAQITASKSKLNMDHAVLDVNLAREKYQGTASVLSSIAEETRSIRDQLQIDSTNYFRQKALWDKQVGTALELEQKKLVYERTLTQYKLLKKKYNQTNVELENSYKKAQNALKRMQADMSDYLIKSKTNGKVYSILKNEGEILGQQETFAQIGNKDLFVIEMLIDEVDITKIKEGLSVYVTLDAYKNKVFEALVTKIYPLKDSRTQTFRVEGHFIKPPIQLYAGLSGEANILLLTKNNVITIPSSYLMEGNKVKTEQGDVNVTVGIQDFDRVEILSGIDSSTVMIKP